MKPVVRVVGLGPGDADLLTLRSLQLLRESPLVRLRTRMHPAADAFLDVASYDDWYEQAESFDELYDAIAKDLVALALAAPAGEVLYCVPGSPVVAERTVELLRASSEITVICEPAVSVIDVACAALGRDPMTSGLRILDALDSSEPLRGPGPLLILQTFSREVLAILADRVPEDSIVTVLHHLGLADQVIAEMPAHELVTFDAVDHLTSVWIEGLRTAGAAMDDLVDFMRRLRRECPWDQEQTHASLTRHLLEESYETLDALETFVRLEGEGNESDDDVAHVEEELGDLLFQIVFHAELGDEEDRFNLATIADAVRVKLTGRHPHVFGDVQVSGSEEVAERWEMLKRDEKGRESITDGIAWQLPALILYTKLLRKAALVDLRARDAEASRTRALHALGALSLNDHEVDDATSSSDVADAWGDALSALVEMAQWAGVDLEGVLRERSFEMRDAIRAAEAAANE
ncbi:MAG TPA: MazG nucleotide pyrophosphohydrolase domain-containing protein [Acidimicrobiales bacterium]